MKEKKEINIQIGERIKKSREAANYTQETFAEQLDVSIQYVSDLERGFVGTSIPTLIKICNVLNVSSDYLLYGQNPQTDTSFIMSKLNQLSPEQLHIVEKGIIAFIEAFNLQDNSL